MRTPLSAKTRMTMPMFMAMVILAAGVAAIAWTVQWSTAGSSERIGQATTAGAAIVAEPVANNVAGALPVFTLDLDGATAYQPLPLDGWLGAADFAKMRAGVSDFVFHGGWWTCAFITNDYAYLPVGVPSPEEATGQDAIDINRWNAMTFREQQNIKEACDR